MTTVLELRRYTTKPRRRDELIELFDRAFIEPQEAVGIDVVGQFRDIDHPDTFTWIRGFTDMDSRLKGLTAFYTGPIWAQNRNTANDTMLDSDDVLLLTPVGPYGFDLPSRQPTGSEVSGVVKVVTFQVTERIESALSLRTAAALSERNGSWSMRACLVTLNAVNNFPALPVRGQDYVLVAVFTADQIGAGETPDWTSIAARHLGKALRSCEIFSLTPTLRSRLR